MLFSILLYKSFICIKLIFINTFKKSFKSFATFVKLYKIELEQLEI